MFRWWLRVAGVALGAGVASGQSIVNGDFAVFVPNNGSGGGWTSEHIDGAGGWRDAGGDRGGYFILNDGGNAATDPLVRQTVEGLIPGWVYAISGEYMSAYINSSPPDFPGSFEVRVDGVAQFQAPPTALGAWTPFEFQFVAGGSAAELLFAGEANGSDNDMAVDNLVITLVPAPAGAIPLMMLLLRRRR